MKLSVRHLRGNVQNLQASSAGGLEYDDEFSPPKRKELVVEAEAAAAHDLRQGDQDLVAIRCPWLSLMDLKRSMSQTASQWAGAAALRRDWRGAALAESSWHGPGVRKDACRRSCDWKAA